MFKSVKKVFLFLVAAMLFAANVNAQEVHGVESKMVCTAECNPDGSWDDWGREWFGGDRYHHEHEPFFAYEFTNLNSIPVSVEVELYKRQKVKSGYNEDIYDFVLYSTKSFVLRSGESYVFKTSEKGIGWYGSHDSFFVKYKAYKLQ